MKRIAFGLSLSLLVVTSGCEKLQEKLAEKAAEKAVESASGGVVTVTDPKSGTTSQGGASVKLPANWPASVPIYPGSTVRNALVSPGAKKAVLVTKDPASKVVEFYKTKSGLTLDSEIDLGAQHIINFKNGKGTVSVVIGQAPPDTSITLAVVD